MNATAVIILILFYIAGLAVVLGNTLAIAKCIPLPWIGNKIEYLLFALQSNPYGNIVYYILLAGICLTTPYVIGVLAAITAGVFD
jgi:hypothetical protein